MEPKKIVIFGASSPKPRDAEYEQAYEIGKLLAEMGFTIVNGGYIGTMEATAKGAKEANGKAIGVTSKILTYSPPNQYLSEVIETDDLFGRIKKFIELGDAFLILPGSTGTLAEFMLVWDHLNLDAAKGSIICYGQHWKPVVEHVSKDERKAVPLKELKFVDSMEELKELLSKF